MGRRRHQQGDHDYVGRCARQPDHVVQLRVRRRRVTIDGSAGGRSMRSTIWRHDTQRQRLLWSRASGLRHVVLRHRLGRQLTQHQTLPDVHRRVLSNHHLVGIELTSGPAGRVAATDGSDVGIRASSGGPPPPSNGAAARGSLPRRPGKPGLAEDSAAAAARVADDAPQGRRRR